MTYSNSLLPPRRSRAPRALRRPTPPLHPHPRAPPPPRHLRCIQPTPPSPTPPRGAFVRNFLPCSPRPLKFWKQRAKMWEREKSPEKGKRRSWVRGLAARTVRPEPLGPNRSSSAERPRDPPSPPAVCSCGTVRPVHLALLERKRGSERKRQKMGRAAMKLGAGSSGPVRPEPLGPNRSSSAERPRELNLFFPFSPSKRFPLSPSRRALRAPRAGNGRHATTRTRVCHSAHHVAVNQLANRV